MSYSSTVLADGAVGYWRLGETAFAQAAVDQTANQNGVYTNTTGLTFSQTGIAGGGGDLAVKFTAANHGSVNIADNATQHVGDTFTVEAWVIAATNSAFQCIGAGLGASAHGWVWYVDAAAKIEVFSRTVGLICTSGSAVPNDSAFHHIVWTKATTATHIYLDGVDVSGSVSNQTVPNSTSIQIGNDSGNTQSFNGTLDEFALYPTALSGAKILTHYRLGANLAPVNTVAPVASGSTTVGSVVSTTNGTWTDAGSPTFTYQWQRDVLGNGTYSNIAGATSSTHTLVLLDDSNDVRCQVTDTDSTGLATTANSNSILDTTPVPGGTSIYLPLLGVG